jgi:hypothetical protein
MRGKTTDSQIINRIIHLRQKGLSINEIKKDVRKSKSLIFKYIQGVEIMPEYRAIWDAKQIGTRKTSLAHWQEARLYADKLFIGLSKKEKLIVGVCLYWAEGTKKDFNLINTDPALVRTFVSFLEVLGVPKDNLRVSLRIYEDINRMDAIRYWANLLEIEEGNIKYIEVLGGKSGGKLSYGMCRVRIIKGGLYLKKTKSIIESIGLLMKSP